MRGERASGEKRRPMVAQGGREGRGRRERLRDGVATANTQPYPPPTQHPTTHRHPLAWPDQPLPPTAQPPARPRPDGPKPEEAVPASPAPPGRRPGPPDAAA
jgi:hypothetical protein